MGPRGCGGIADRAGLDGRRAGRRLRRRPGVGAHRAERAPHDGAIGVPATEHLKLPDPTGAFVDFDVQPVSVMEDELAARHPELKTYAGHATNDPTTSVRLSITPLGVSASVRSGDNRSVPWYIDPVPSDAGSAKPKHISYGRDVAREGKGAAQFLEPREEAPVPDAAPGEAPKATRQVIPLALVSDPGFAQFYGNRERPGRQGRDGQPRRTDLQRRRGRAARARQRHRAAEFRYGRGSIRSGRRVRQRCVLLARRDARVQ